MKSGMPPVHPGEILLEDFLKPMGITQYRIAKSIGVPQRRMGEFMSGNKAQKWLDRFAMLIVKLAGNFTVS